MVSEKEVLLSLSVEGSLHRVLLREDMTAEYML